MIDSENTPGLTAAAQLEQLAALGMMPENNLFFSGRLPPTASTGLHPASFYQVYNNGGLMDELKAALPSPVPKPTLEFNEAASEPDAPNSPSNRFDPKFL